MPSGTMTVSPFKLVHGYAPTLPVNLQYNLECSVPAADSLLGEQQRLWDKAQEAMKKSQGAQKQHADRRHREADLQVNQ